jgi:hypothetical protein
LLRVDKNFFSKISEFMHNIFYTQPKTMHKREAHPDSLHRIREKLYAMSYEEKCSTLKNMSLPLLRLTCAVLYLPKEIIKKHIVSVLFEGHIEAIEQFYVDPVEQALTLYHTIEKNCGGKPIGPLYVAKQSIRDALLTVLQSKSQNNAGCEISEGIHTLLKKELSEDLKELYLKGKTVTFESYGIGVNIMLWIIMSTPFHISILIPIIGITKPCDTEPLISLFCHPVNLIICGLVWGGTGIRIFLPWTSECIEQVTY